MADGAGQDETSVRCFTLDPVARTSDPLAVSDSALSIVQGEVTFFVEKAALLELPSGVGGVLVANDRYRPDSESGARSSYSPKRSATRPPNPASRCAGGGFR